MPLIVSRIRAICFDVDGTLSDTDDQMVAQFIKFLRPVNFLLRKQPLPFVARRMVMTLESPAHLLMGVPDFLGLDEPAAWLFSGINRAIWRRRRNNFLLVSSVREMLQSLSQRYPLAVVSARDEISTRAFMEQYELLPFFQCIATAQTCYHTRPFPDPILWRAAGAQKVGV